MEADTEALLRSLSLPSPLRAVLTLFKLLHVTHLGDNRRGGGEGGVGVNYTTPQKLSAMGTEVGGVEG